MKKITIVIGSNYGDEGKGRAVSYFCKAKRTEDNKTIVIRSNGGAQAGHTVVGDNRVIFSHFGSGSMEKRIIPTYLSDKFIVNPMFFRKEYMELIKKNIHPVVYVNEKCIITTPFDILINQIWETSLGKNRYGSCGAGIYETVIRNNTSYKTNILTTRNSFVLKNQLERIKSFYFENRLNFVLGKNNKPSSFYKKIIDSDLITPFLVDVKFFLNHVKIIKNDEEEKFLNSYDSIIFEGAQGLLLDKDREKYGENVTPSNTGIKNPYEIIKRNNLDKDYEVEVCYSTRWYMTRHGNGILKNSCKKEDLSDRIIDKTNIPNEFQGSIRFGYLDLEEFFNRIYSDFDSVGENWDISIMLNCLDQIKENEKYKIINNGIIQELNIRELLSYFNGYMAKRKNSKKLYIGKNEKSCFTIPKRIIR